jgi:hypothetical protein
MVEKYEVSRFNKFDLFLLLTGGAIEIEESLNKGVITKILDDKLNKVKPEENMKVLRQIAVNEKHGLDRKNKNHINVSLETLNFVYSFIHEPQDFDFESLERIYLKFISSLIKHRNETSDKSIIFNNDAHIYNNDTIMDITTFHKILVFRNPLDQYSRRKTISYNFKVGFMRRIWRFMSYTRHYVTNSTRTIKLIKRDSNINLINYEFFILNDFGRASILKKLGCNDEHKMTSNFNVNYSISNIGVYKNNLNIIEMVVLFIFCYPFFMLLRNSSQK